MTTSIEDQHILTMFRYLRWRVEKIQIAFDKPGPISKREQSENIREATSTARTLNVMLNRRLHSRRKTGGKGGK